MLKKMMAALIVVGLIAGGTSAFAAEKQPKQHVKVPVAEKAAALGISTTGLTKKQIHAAVVAKVAELKAAKQAAKTAKKAAKEAAKAQKKAGKKAKKAQ